MMKVKTTLTEALTEDGEETREVRIRKTLNAANIYLRQKGWPSFPVLWRQVGGQDVLLDHAWSDTPTAKFISLTTGVWSEHGFTFTKKDAHTYVITDKE
jgi:hypothetical protein